MVTKPTTAMTMVEEKNQPQITYPTKRWDFMGINI